MPFSLGSYLLGVGTVVGALAFGVGGGLLLTHAAMKESPAGHTRVERLARAELPTPAARRVPAAQITPLANRAAVSDQVPTPDQDQPASPEQPPAIAPNPQAGTPKPAPHKPEETPRQVQAATQLPRQPIVQAARQPPPKQIEQTEKRPSNRWRQIAALNSRGGMLSRVGMLSEGSRTAAQPERDSGGS